MKLKEGVSLAKIVPELDTARHLVEDCYAAFGVDCVLTSGDEETTAHHGQPVGTDPRDPHYMGKALDFRIKHVAPEFRESLVANIRARLGDQFVVLWEGVGIPLEHIHVQYGHVLA